MTEGTKAVPSKFSRLAGTVSGDIGESRMPGSRTPVFGEAEDFQAVLTSLASARP